MAKEIIYVICPLCALSRPLVKTGIYQLWRREKARAEPKYQFDKPGPVRFDYLDPEVGPFLRLSEARGGREGIVEQQTYTLAEVIASGEANDLLDQIRATIKKLDQLLS